MLCLIFAQVVAISNLLRSSYIRERSISERHSKVIGLFGDRMLPRYARNSPNGWASLSSYGWRGERTVGSFAVSYECASVSALFSKRVVQRLTRRTAVMLLAVCPRCN
jgi:hypothetical protein